MFQNALYRSTNLLFLVTIFSLLGFLQSFSISSRSTTFSKTSTPNPHLHSRSSLQRNKQFFMSENDNTDTNSNDGIDISIDPRLYRIRLPRAPGIEWGTDLSFAFVSIRSMDPSGPASLSKLMSVGDQICELRAVSSKNEATVPVPLIGAPFDTVMNAFVNLDRTVTDVDLVMFRGTKQELQKLCSNNNNQSNDDTIVIKVIENKGSPQEKVKTIKTTKGANVRQTLVDEGINVYQSVTRWTNCKGKQLCGTCIVNIKDGGANTNRKSVDEESTLRENPDSYRLSCVTFAYGDVTVETFPPIKAAQWTR